MKLLRGLLVLAVVALLVAFFAFGWGHYFTLEYFQSQRAAIASYQQAHLLAVLLAFCLIYVISVAASFPGATILTLAAGAMFGLFWGTVIVSFASSVGATLAFWLARFVLRDTIQRRYGDKLKGINQSFAREGAFYLFTLRLVPAFPFFLINLVMGLTPIRTWTYYWVTQVGALAGTVVYVNAGTQIGQLTSLRGILSPGLIGSFVLLGVFPYIAKAALTWIKARRVYRGFRRPKRYDRNLIVVGAGAAGLVSAYIAATVRAKVTLIEKHKMGGDCLNYGCVPSKALLRSAKLLDNARRSREFGVAHLAAECDFAEVMTRVQRVVAQVAPHDSVQRYTELGVEVLQGQAMIRDPWTVEVTGADGATQTLTTRQIIVAAGAEPFVPPIPGLAESGYLTSDTLWSLRRRPHRLVVLGGGPIGSEMTQAFARLGCAVTQVEMLPRLLMREDPEVSAHVLQRFRAEGVDVRLDTRAQAVVVEDGQKILVCEHAGIEQRIPFDEILVAVGRAARLKGYGLEALGAKTGKTLEVNSLLQTNFPNIYACGDVAGPYQFTHTASHMAWYAAVNALFGGLLWLRGGRFKVDYSVVPWATFTEPEVARVGLNEIEAREKGIAYEVVSYDLADLDRAIADGEAHGLVKVLTVPGKDRILGVTVVGEHAGDLIAEYVLAMKQGIGLNKILGTMHIYPTLAEANKYAAGLWKQAHKPEKLLRWVQKYHDWLRG